MSTPTPPISAEAPHVDESLITYTHVIYGLHALAVLIGLSTAHTIVGSFVGGLPSIVAVIMNYARRAATRGTFLESHFRWQIRTFWFALLWSVVIVLVSAPFMLVLIGFGFAWAGLFALGIWIAYRVIRGWLALKDRRPMYV
ncbi:MAG TPA: hypothetical protein VK695_04130 [Steroidobacteraceae bacterium]|jgi:uncharacterized membrane protein|nr:hypothetical protein [Steroidobacteraceae bacterium]